MKRLFNSVTIASLIFAYGSHVLSAEIEPMSVESHVHERDMIFLDSGEKKVDALRGAPEIMVYSTSGEIIYQNGGILSEIKDVGEIVEDLEKLLIKKEKVFTKKTDEEHREAMARSESIMLGAIEDYMQKEKYPNNIITQVLNEQRPMISKALEAQVYSYDYLSQQLRDENGGEIEGIIQGDYVLAYFKGANCTSCSQLNLALNDFFKVNNMNLTVLSIRRAQ